MNTHIKQGVIDAIPLMVSLFFVFSSVGALYQENGLAFSQAVAGSALIFAAPLQIALLDIIANHQMVTGIALTMLINFRFLLMAMVMAQHFKKASKLKIGVAMMTLTASTYAVTHVYLKTITDSQAQMHYYLSVGIPSYLIAILATLCGFMFSRYMHYSTIESLIAMIIPIHFTALTAKNTQQPLIAWATLIGGLCTPFLAELSSNGLKIGTPILVGTLLAFIETKIKK